MILTVEAIQNFVLKNADKILDDVFMDFRSANHMTHLPNNKGKEEMGLSEVGEEIVKRWTTLSVNDGQQSVDITKMLDVQSYHSQFHEKYVPERLEKSYYGHLRKSGQNPKDFPFQAYVIMLLTKAIRKHNEKCLWQSVKDDNSNSGLALFDGLKKQVADAVTAADLTPTVFGTPWKDKKGVYTAPTGSTSIIDILEEMHDSFDDEVKEMGVKAYLPTKYKTMYNQAYRNRHGTAPTTDKEYNIERTILDGTEDTPCEIVGIGGLMGSDRIIMTPVENVIYTYDMEEDASNFNEQYILNVLHLFGSYRIGSKFLRANDRFMKVNELT